MEKWFWITAVVSSLMLLVSGGSWGPVVKVPQVLGSCNWCAELQIQLMVHRSKRRAWKVGSEG